MTGGNSGLGFYSVVNFLKLKNYIFIPIKSIKRKDQFLVKLNEYFEPYHLHKYLQIINEVDLCDLKNINKITGFLQNKNIKLDILILNAGIQYTGSKYPKVSKQGLEMTFAVNHLSHFVLTNRLIPFMSDTNGTRIIITSSDVHDPKSPGGNIGKKAGLNNLVGFKDTIMGKFIHFNADRSYKNSKLCNILFAKELSILFEKNRKKISVVTWAPGLVIPENELGFFRYSSKFNKIGYQIFAVLAKRVLGVSENVKDAGNLLSSIAMDEEFNNITYLHLSNRLIAYRKHELIKTDVSKEANNSFLSRKLWDLSEEICELIGISLVNI